MSREITDSGCWLYTMSRRGKYGQISYRHKQYSVHRLSAHIYLGLDLNSELQVNHKTNCPHKHCFNPDHLYIGTQKDNMNDRVSQLMELPCGHLKVNLYSYRSKDGKIYKWCRACRRKQRHEYWVKYGC